MLIRLRSEMISCYKILMIFIFLFLSTNTEVKSNSLAAKTKKCSSDIQVKWDFLFTKVDFPFISLPALIS